MKKTIKNILKLIVVLILIAGAIASAISAIWTIIPESSASKENRIGYKSHCTFTPISTIILIFIVVVFCFILIKIKYLKLFVNKT